MFPCAISVTIRCNKVYFSIPSLIFFCYRKKIRIHLPQKVKHIHHHKKIYITNHPVPSQYAPAYMPSAEGTVAVPTSVALPAMANIVPINPVDLFDETQPRLPTIAPAASQLLPLYHARGYYGPMPSEVEEPDEDVSDNIDYAPQSYSTPTQNSNQPKRLKIIKINEQPRKKIIRKVKPKRIVIRNKPLPPPPADGEHPVSTFHEQFYSDIDGSGTIRKLRKPPRVEKIVDGDTEHIHTYSEEHIHKVMVDEGPKVNGIIGVDPYNGMPAISNGHHLIPLKNGQQLIAVASNPFSGLAAVGSLNNPTHFDYAAYNPREVTHDHIFHDHGEIPPEADINRDALGYPPKVSYDSHGLRIATNNRQKSKNYQKNKKIIKPSSGDFSYYESIYSPNTRPNKGQRPLISIPSFDGSEEGNNYEEYRPISEYGYKENYKKTRSPVTSYYGKSSNDYRVQSSPPAPFSVSSTVVHEYKPKRYPGSSPSHASLTKFRDPFANFKDSYSNNFEYDTYASSSNIYTSEDKNDVEYTNQNKKGKKKSISTQNISFGGKDHVSYVDHLEEDKFADGLDSDGPTALENVEQFNHHENSDIVTPNTFTLKESSPLHQYYSLMATKALQSDQMSSVPEASNDNFQFAEAPSVSTTAFPSVATKPNPSLNHYSIPSTERPYIEPSKFLANTKSSKTVESGNRYNSKDNQKSTRDSRTRPSQNHESNRSHDQDSLIVRGNLKYGDKI